MLMREDKEKQPFRSYEAMAAKCSQLVQDKRALEAQLEAPMPQVSALESSVEVLYHQLYNSSNQLQLSSPVRKHSSSRSPGPCWAAAGEHRESSAILPGCRGETSLPLSQRGRGGWPDPCLVPKAIQ